MPKILLVEDEKILREAFTILLKAHGYEVDSAGNGQEALELWRADEYGLVLLDLMMPILDGIGFLVGAKAPKTAPETRIVILSNLSSGELPEAALKLGAHRHEIKANLARKDILRIVDEEMTIASTTG